MSIIAETIALIAAVANLVLCGWWSVEIRRARALNFLLGMLCMRAFVDQHMPYWKPWGEVFGYRLEIRVMPRREDKAPNDDAR